jgi:lysyl-tRNA synthetase class 2
MEDCAALLALAAETAGAREFAFRDRTADPLAELERITVAEAFQRFARIDLLATVSRDGATDRDALATTAATLGIRVAADDTWADVFSRVIVERIEPGLGLGQPTILYEYPTPEAALARPAGRDPPGGGAVRALRLRGGAGQRVRRADRPARAAAPLHAEMARRSASTASAIRSTRTSSSRCRSCRRPAARRWGFDRLVMLATGAERIEQVLWTPVSETP